MSVAVENPEIASTRLFDGDLGGLAGEAIHVIGGHTCPELDAARPRYHPRQHPLGLAGTTIKAGSIGGLFDFGPSRQI